MGWSAPEIDVIRAVYGSGMVDDTQNVRRLDSRGTLVALGGIAPCSIDVLTINSLRLARPRLTIQVTRHRQQLTVWTTREVIAIFNPR